jgi:hypothetical protein
MLRHLKLIFGVFICSPVLVAIYFWRNPHCGNNWQS